MPPVPRPEQWGWIVAALGLLAVAGLTLYPIPGAAAAAQATPLYCLACGPRGGVDVFLNVLLFIPLGLGVRRATGSARRAVATAVIVSLAVELLQLTVVPGRDASLSDLLSNTTGGAAGAVLGARLGLVAGPPPGAAQRLLLAAAAGWLTLLGLSAWLQAPDFSDGVIVSVWGGVPGRPYAFRGRVLSVTVDGRSMPGHGLAPDTAALRRSLRRGRISVDLRMRSSPRSDELQWLYVIGDQDGVVLFLSQRGREVAFGYPARSLRFRLNPPTVALRGALPADPGVPVGVRAGSDRQGIWVATSVAGRTRKMAVTLSPARGWVLVAPFGLALGPGVRLITGLVVLGLWLPLGYWAAATRRVSWSGAVLGGALLLGLGAIPALGGFAPVHWSEWLAAGAGAGCGWALHRAAAYLALRCGSPSTDASSSS